MVEAGRGRGSQLMECSLDQTLQGTLALSCGAWATLEQFTLGWDLARALFGPAREPPAGAGPAGQHAAFLGRAV
jgi:hypothetical protein